jgi:hypothetical protein
MEHINDMQGLLIKEISLNEKTGQIEIEFQSEEGWTDFFIAEISGLRMATISIVPEPDIDFQLVNFKTLEHVFDFFKGKYVMSVMFSSQMEIDNPPPYLDAFYPSYYVTDKTFLKRLEINVDAEELVEEEEEQCMGTLMLEIVSAQSPVI